MVLRNDLLGASREWYKEIVTVTA
ncbi:hypothetical protein NC652_040735 [Populus alba x Populus x berolinensis]|nr:hypothetical protein NC652_040735 [Populus alba x Populus x berolinensis]